MHVRARSWLAEGLLVLLALGTLALLPGCPFFTRQDRDEAPAPAAADDPHAGHDHAPGAGH